MNADVFTHLADAFIHSGIQTQQMDQELDVSSCCSILVSQRIV